MHPDHLVRLMERVMGETPAGRHLTARGVSTLVGTGPCSLLLSPAAPLVPASVPTVLLDASQHCLNDGGGGDGGGDVGGNVLPAPSPVAAIRAAHSSTDTTAVTPAILGLRHSSTAAATGQHAASIANALARKCRWPYAAAGFREAERMRQTHGHTRDAALHSRKKMLPTVLLGSRINPLSTFRGHRKEVFCAIFDKSGCRAVTGSDDHLVKIWSTETGLLLHACRGHTGRTNAPFVLYCSPHVLPSSIACIHLVSIRAANA